MSEPYSAEKDADPRLTIHAWGFFENGCPRTPDGIAVSAESPHDAFARIRANITHHGGLNTNTRILRTLDGWFIGADWETPEREDGSAARMWHKVSREADSWPMPTTVLPPGQTHTEEPTP